MVGSRVAIVIPAFNESATISTVVRHAGAYGLPIVVDDGSTDNTAELAGQAGSIVVSHQRNCGYDMALNSGFQKANELGCEIIITLDGDGQHNPDMLKDFIKMIDSGFDLIIGIRSRKQRIAEHIFSLYSNFCFGIKDPLCGIKAYRIKLYKDLGHFDSYGSIGTELMIFAANKAYRVGQLPFTVMEREGESRFGQGLRGNYRILRSLFLSLVYLKGKK